jgi:hypothetical protein
MRRRKVSTKKVIPKKIIVVVDGQEQDRNFTIVKTIEDRKILVR